MAVNTITRYARIWWRSAAIGIGLIAQSRLDIITFVLGKLIRMGFFVVFVISLFGKTIAIGSYGRGEVLLFFAIMNFIDVVTQLLWYRGLTDLGTLIRKGWLDTFLTKPLSPLFYVAFHIFDFFDLITVPAAIAFLWYAVHALAAPLTMGAILLTSIVVCISLVLAFSINLILASISFWTVELDNAWWLYRDLVYVSRIPPDVFPKLVRFFFTYIIPIMVIVNFPTKALLGLLSPTMILWAVIITGMTLTLALSIWRMGLKRYTSASS